MVSTLRGSRARAFPCHGRAEKCSAAAHTHAHAVCTYTFVRTHTFIEAGFTYYTLSTLTTLPELSGVDVFSVLEGSLYQKKNGCEKRSAEVVGADFFGSSCGTASAEVRVPRASPRTNCRFHKSLRLKREP